ncbi:MAG: HAD family hydrolase [bacterium]|nr:HAD family hydrolase [bacterium]
MSVNSIQTKPSVIFDWSGVISNDLDIVLETYNDMFALYGKGPFSLTEFRKTFELPYDNYCKNVLGDTVSLETLQYLFQDIYLKKTIQPYVIPGVEDILKRLKEAQIPMVVLSSHSFVKKEARDYFPETEYFQKIYDDVPDKRDCIPFLLDEMRFNPETTFYVGDMIHDIETGRHANVKTIAITTGYQSYEMLKSANPDFLINTLSELLPILNIS